MSHKILITGGTGFVGSHLARHLLNSQPEAELHLTTYKISPDESPTNQAEIHALDLTDFVATKELLGKIKPDQIYHLAAIPIVGGSFEKAAEIMFNNTNLQLSLFQAVIELMRQESSYKPRILVVGSAEEYGISQSEELPINENHPLRPVNPYAVSKVAQDLMSYAFFVSRSIDIVRVRPFNHIGAGQVDAFVVSAFAKQIALIEKGEQIEMSVGNLETIRDFTDVRDMVRAYQLLMEKGVSGEVYNVGTGVGVAISSVLDQLVKISNAEIKIVIDQSKMRPNDVQAMIADSSKINQLGWQPNIELNQTLEWVLNDWRKKV